MQRRFSLLAVLLTAVTATAQTTYLWNSSNSVWNTATSWTPNVVPTSLDTALFNSSGAAAGTPVLDPQLTSNQAALALTFALNQNLGGWTLTQDATPRTLTIGGTGSTGISTFGPATYTINGPSLAGASATNTLNFNVTNASTLVLTGLTAVTANQGTTRIGGGTLRLDNSTTNVASRLQSSASLFFQSGTLELIGGTTATTYLVGALANSSTAGLNIFRVTPTGGAVPTLTFNNSGAFNSRLSTFSLFQFETTSGVLGTDARITFSGTPGTGANGLLASTTSNPSTSGTFGYAIVKDTTGSDFATFSATTGVVAAGATETRSTIATITSTTNVSRVFYTPAANDSASAILTVGSLRITPTAAVTVAFAANNLVTNALMLNGTNDLTISGTGILGATGTHYIYVTDPATTLTTGLVVVSGANPTGYAGPGFLAFNGTSVQDQGQAGTGNNRFDLHGGVVRGTNANFGFIVAAAGSDTFAAINFRGGVVEIQGGANGNGTSADFTRTLGTTDGQVRWEGGNGGFSAFGTAATVNIGGTATPASLQWNAANFVTDGYALKFGSTKSTAVLNWLNPIQLDNGTAYQLREFNVVDNTASVADRTVIAAVISGAANADLVKTGNGTLNFNSANTYAGKTLVSAGRLNITSTPTGTGTYTVGSGGTLGGSGTITPAITVLAGGTLQGGATAVGTLNVNTLAFAPASRIGVVVTNGTTSAAAGTGGSTSLNSNTFLNKLGGTLSGLSDINVVVDLNGITFASPASPYSYQVGAGFGDRSDLNINDPSRFTFVNVGVNGGPYVPSLTGNSTGDLFLNFTPAPEPMALIALGAFALAFRRRR